jgi:hypothetical protein
MSRAVCADEEELLRGITSADFDEDELIGEFFAEKAVSVNRLCISDLTTSIDWFKVALEDPDRGVRLRGYASFQHLKLKELTKNYVAQNKDLTRNKFTIWVEEAPILPDNPEHLPENPAHAEVMPKVQDALSRYLLKNSLFDLHLDL